MLKHFYIKQMNYIHNIYIHVNQYMYMTLKIKKQHQKSVVVLKATVNPEEKG